MFEFVYQNAVDRIILTSSIATQTATLNILSYFLTALNLIKTHLDNSATSCYSYSTTHVIFHKVLMLKARHPPTKKMMTCPWTRSKGSNSKY